MAFLLSRIISILVIFLLPICAFSSGTEKFLVQKNGVIIPIQKVILNLKGSIEPIQNTSSYSVKILNQKYIVDLKTGNNVENMIFAISPVNKKVNILFISVLPNKEIFFDNNPLDAVTDSKGNALIKDFYPEPGDHWLELCDGNRTVAKAKLTIKSKSDFKCSGKKMKCSIVNV